MLDIPSSEISVDMAGKLKKIRSFSEIEKQFAS
jgi:hypothetical protein